MLTVAYLTSRKEPKFDWFMDSLAREIKREGCPLPRVVVVDFHHSKDRYPRGMGYGMGYVGEIINANPKPTVWQGEHRLTKQDYFAASNARNTAICLAPDGWIAFVDDLAVLLPGWLRSVQEAMVGNYIVCGAYRKVNKLVVERGILKSFEPHPPGEDSRTGNDNAAVDCKGTWLYGCSLAAPVEAFLQINGYPEICDGMGYEDCVTGKMIENNGWRIKYDRRMMTYESEELHHVETPMKREDPGVSPNDKSHAILKLMLGEKSTPGFFGPEGIRGLRQRVLNGEPFPIMKIPEHEWFTGKRLCEL